MQTSNLEKLHTLRYSGHTILSHTWGIYALALKNLISKVQMTRILMTAKIIVPKAQRTHVNKGDEDLYLERIAKQRVAHDHMGTGIAVRSVECVALNCALWP